MRRICCAALLALALCGGPAQAAGLAVVDVERVFRESAPGKAGEAHLQQARDILQKGLDDLRALYKGREATAEAQAALRDGHAALERQLAVERHAVRQALAATLENVIRVWFAANAKSAALDAVAPASALFAYDRKLDVTDAVMRDMDKENPAFAALPSVTVQAAPKAATPKAETPRAATRAATPKANRKDASAAPTRRTP